MTSAAAQDAPLGFGKFKQGDAVLYYDKKTSTLRPATIAAVDHEGQQYAIELQGEPELRFTVDERLSCAQSLGAGGFDLATGLPRRHQQKYVDINSLCKEPKQGHSPGPKNTDDQAAAPCDMVDMRQSQSVDEQQLAQQPAATYTCINGTELPFGPAEVQRLLRPYKAPGSADDYLNDEIVNICMDMFIRDNHKSCSHSAGTNRCYAISSLFYPKLMSW